jgi:hypothetical protein
MATPILTDRANTIDKPTQSTIQSPNILVRSFDLVSFRYFSKADEAICVVRDQTTGAVKRALASQLLTYSFGKDAYLLELQRFSSLAAAEGGVDHV